MCVLYESYLYFQLIVSTLLSNHVCILQREEIRLMVERDGSAKAIVFSQFTSFLDLINYTLGKVKYKESNTHYGTRICSLVFD